MNGVILGYDDDGDHVPELGVKGVHEHVQSLQERTQNQDTCRQGLLCLTAKSQLRCSHIFNFKFAIFLEI